MPAPRETESSEPGDARSLEREVAQLQFLLRTIADALLIFNDDGSVRWASDSLEAVSGWTLADLQAIDPLSLVHPDDADSALSHFFDAVAGRTRPGVAATCRLRSAEGTWGWVEVEGLNLRDEPLVDGLLMIIRDATARVEAESALRSSERRFEALVRNSNDCLMVTDENLRLTYASPSILQMLGFDASVAMSVEFGTGVLEPDRSRLFDAYHEAIAQPGSTPRAQVRVPHADGGIRWIETVLSSHLDDPDVRGVVSNTRDVTEQHALLEQLQQRTARVEAAERASRRLASVFNQTNDLAVLLDHNGHVTYLNSAAQQFFGIASDEVDDALGRPFRPLDGRLQQIFDESPAGASAPQWSGEMTMQRHDDVAVPMLIQVIQHRTDTGAVEYYSAVAHDISDRKAMEQSLQRQATHDPLTGLPNRALLYERLERALAGLDSLGSSHSVALLFIDIDHFKVVNDSLGHAVGDELLRVIADRLSSVVRPGDTVARFGGDEFVVLCERLEHAEDAVVIAHRVDVSLNEPITVGEHESRVGVSIGIAYADPDDRDATAILRDADTAMYRAKSDGRGRWVIFDEHLRHQAVERQSVETALRRTRHGEELQLHYQPVVDLISNRIIGVEALVRWQFGDAVVPPESFIPIAEETGLIIPIGTWVMETATRQVAKWQQLPGWEDLQLAVNVSARQLLHHSFSNSVQSCVAESGITPGSLSIEITESVLLDDMHSARTQLELIRSLGLGVALDDFGTGYSSLTYLHRLPADVVKLDRSFVAGVGTIDGDTAIVTAVVNLATALGLKCVAEGIETVDQLERLRGLGCEYGQGYYLSCAVSPEDFHDQFLAEPLTTLPLSTS